MYVKSAELYDYLYHFKDYTIAATALRQMIVEQRPDANCA